MLTAHTHRTVGAGSPKFASVGMTPPTARTFRWLVHASHAKGPLSLFDSVVLTCDSRVPFMCGPHSPQCYCCGPESGERRGVVPVCSPWSA